MRPLTRRLAARPAYRSLLLGGVLLLTLGWYALAPTGSGAGGDDSRYVEGVIGEPVRLNPLFARRDTADADIAALVFSGLTRPDAQGLPSPDLAREWEVTPDGLTYTFHLRGGLSWHDGRPLTAHDVAFTVEQVQRPGFQGPARLAAEWAGVEVLVPNEETVIFRLPARSALFLSSTSLGIVPEHLLRDRTIGELLSAPFNAAPVGSGPYRVVDVSPRIVRLERNPSYHLGVPRIAALDLRFFADERALAEALRTGSIDGALLPAQPSADALAATAARGLATTLTTAGGYDALYVNNQRSLLADPTLRRALAAAIDREALIEDLQLDALPGDGPLLPGSWAEAGAEWPAPEQAGPLFAEAGWTPGAGGVLQDGETALSLRLATDETRGAVAERVAGMLRAHGVDIDIEVLPGTVLLRDRIQPRDFDLLLFGWTVGLDPDPFGGWHTSQIAASGANVAGFHDEASDGLLERARGTLDIAERRELYGQFAQRFAELAPAVVLYYPQRPYVHPPALEGPREGLLLRPHLRFIDVHTWSYQ